MRRAIEMLMLVAALLPAPAAMAAAPVRIQGSAALPDRFVLGRDATGEPCVAARNWRDARVGDVFDRAWSITCRGVAASRPQGYVLRVADDKRAAVPPSCGAPVEQALAGIGKVAVRRCDDAVLGFVATHVHFRRHGQTFVGAAAETATGPLEAVLRAAARVAPVPTDRDAPGPVTLRTAALALPPARAAATPVAVAAQGFDAGTALQAGIALNHRGLYVEASRLLNDALSRLVYDAAPLTRAELELEAGLADSNISQVDAAEDHFARATALLDANKSVASAALEAKRATYRGLDLLNRRQWRQAVGVMAEDAVTANPLSDPAVLSRLNQPAERGGARPTLSAALSAVDGAQFARLMLEAQRDWARSVALLALGDTGASRTALDRAALYVAQLQRSVDPDALIAVKSRIQRQYARVAARAGKIDQSLAYFDCALATLQAQPPSATKPCPIDAPRGRAVGTADAAAGPLTAETQLERASVLARKPGVSRQQLLADYDAGVDALIASNAASGVPFALEGYLDTLAQAGGDGKDAALAEQYFRAVQAIGEPAIARQLAQLQSVVTVDGTLGAQVRDRAEVERRIVQLRYQIAATPPTDTAALAALEAERRTAEDRLATLNAAVARDPRFRAVDDQPATIAQIRTALRPGEVYLKVSRLRTRAFATVIAADRSYIYPLAAPAEDVDAIARRVRASIRDDSGRLPFFDVAASYALFKLVAGPAEAALRGATAIVVDPSGALQYLPAGVLVTDIASVRAHAAQGKGRRNDYSQVAFLAAQAELSNALSPRSFLIARRLAESRAPDAFIGFGENAPPEALSGALATRAVSFGTGCAMPYDQLAAIMSANKPVSAREISLAATALGVPNAPQVIGRAFTDSAVMTASAAGDYTRYQVVHFATHGLPETRSGCTVVPPSLVTTLAPPTENGGYPSDGLLSFAEIARLRLDANLVVLSACETAAGVSSIGGRLGGQDESAATLDGLVRAFITANARAVLATYWKVPAIEETDRFFQTFYADGRRATIGTALKAAQTMVMRDPSYSHPYYWGAYFLVGDAGKSMLTPAAATAPARVALR
jgi:hypothetical protein